MATLIRTDGTESEIRPENGKNFELDEMYRLIGNRCDIVEAIVLGDGTTMWIDEEGKLRWPTPAINRKATRLLVRAGGIRGDFVVGNVLIATPAETGDDDV